MRFLLEMLKDMWRLLTTHHPSTLEQRWEGLRLQLRDLDRRERAKKERRMFELARRLSR